MTSFKAGDRVRYRTDRYLGFERTQGEGVITTLYADRSYGVTIDADHGVWSYSGDELELIEPEPVYDINPGDRFRFTVEGVFDTSGGGKGGLNVGTYDATRDFDVTSSGDDTVTIEKIEPPVVTFKPGDIVRVKGGNYKFLLTEQGYLCLDRDFYHYNGGTPRWDSREFEKVELHESPL